MTHINRTVESQDTRDNDGTDQVIIAQPLSQAEIDELLYSDEFSREDRLARLRYYRDELSEREASDFGFDDPGALLKQVQEAISALEDGFGESMDPASVDHNPEDHRETLSPDSDELEAIEQADEDSLSDDIVENDVLDETEWTADGDGFDPDRGVH
ncbi:MAG: hypothetical protein EOP19_07750 [Hyphomicrobiales bacterium]|nr:MAG: hypothetical protein EOP19_07750 [Hyphomicrobiales bacterium]